MASAQPMRARVRDVVAAAGSGSRSGRDCSVVDRLVAGAPFGGQADSTVAALARNGNTSDVALKSGPAANIPTLPPAAAGFISRNTLVAAPQNSRSAAAS